MPALVSGSAEVLGLVFALAQDAVASTQLSSSPVAAVARRLRPVRRTGRGEAVRVLMRDSYSARRTVVAASSLERISRADAHAPLALVWNLVQPLRRWFARKLAHVTTSPTAVAINPPATAQRPPKPRGTPESLVSSVASKVPSSRSSMSASSKPSQRRVSGNHAL